MALQNSKSFRRLLYFFFTALFCLKQTALPAQAKESLLLSPSASFNEKRFRTVVLSEAGFSSLVAIGLNYLWYKRFPRSRFHFINDNAEWLNMDKAGHATTAYNIAAVQYDAMRWCGVNKTRANVIAGLTGLGFLTIIEIFDGFSSQWGFSKGDMLANIVGSGLFVGQQSLWQQQRIQLRFSYHNSPFAKYNSEELGRTFWQRWLKDYNGQTYWISFHVGSFLSAQTITPRWLNADIGYGAEGMVAGRSNPSVINGKEIPSFARYRQLYFGIDAAFKKQGKEVIPFAGWINLFRLPTPVVQWDLNHTPLKLKPLFF